MTIAPVVLLSAFALTVIVVSGAFAVATRVRPPGLYLELDAQGRRETWWSIGSAAIQGVPAGIVAWGVRIAAGLRSTPGQPPADRLAGDGVPSDRGGD